MKTLVTVLILLLVQGVDAQSNSNSPSLATAEELQKYIAKKLEREPVNKIIIGRRGERAMGSICPHFAMFPPKARAWVWAKFMTDIAQTESQLDPKKVYRSSPDKVDFGLFGIPYGAARVANCDVPNADQLLEPDVNIDCAIKIMRARILNGSVIIPRSTHRKSNQQNTMWPYLVSKPPKKTLGRIQSRLITSVSEVCSKMVERNRNAVPQVPVETSPRPISNEGRVTE